MNQSLIYLASASPRRAELLRQIGVQFQVAPVDVDETPRQGVHGLVAFIHPKATNGLMIEVLQKAHH